MSDNRHKELARKVVLFNKAKKKLNKAQSLVNLRNGRERAKDNAISSSQSTPQRQSSFHGTPHTIGENVTRVHSCLTELYGQARVIPNRRRFTMSVIAMSMADIRSSIHVSA